MDALPFCKATLCAPRPVADRYPVAPQTPGDHLRRRRLDLRLTQKVLAARLGVSTTSVLNWERNRRQAHPTHLGAITSFLGYFPSALAQERLGDRIRAARHMLGLSQKRLAERLGVNEGTVSKWERGRKRPFLRFTRLFEEFVESSVAEVAQAKREHETGVALSETTLQR